MGVLRAEDVPAMDDAATPAPGDYQSLQPTLGTFRMKPAAEGFLATSPRFTQDSQWVLPDSHSPGPGAYEPNKACGRPQPHVHDFGSASPRFVGRGSDCSDRIRRALVGTPSYRHPI